MQPCVWAERFITPARTEVMQFLYLNFFWIAPLVTASCFWQAALAESSAPLTLGVIACFYLGYALYVIFPAAPPAARARREFTKNLHGYPAAFSSLSAEALSLLPVPTAARRSLRFTPPSRRSRSSMPGATLRPLFFMLLPFVIGLWVSTIYLRHHYFVDSARRLGARSGRGVARAADRRWWAGGSGS